MDIFGVIEPDHISDFVAFIPIQHGCNNFCSYCLIPMVRGRATSRNDKDIYDNIRKVVDHGFKEVVLTGVNMGRYQYQDVNFETLIENILKKKIYIKF